MIKIAARFAASAAAAAAVLGVLASASPAGAVVPRSLLPDPRIPTAITAVVQPAGGLELTGTLTTAAGLPVAGATVTFTTAGSSRFLCSGVTDASGLAECAITGAQRTLIRTGSGGIWWSRFAGDLLLQPAERAGHI